MESAATPARAVLSKQTTTGRTAKGVSSRAMKGFVKRDAPPNDSRIKVHNQILLTNPHMRKFRNFALAYIAFNSNKRGVLELGRHRRRKDAVDEAGALSNSNFNASTNIVDSQAEVMAKYMVSEVLVKNWWIILPDSNARRLWEVWMLAPMLYVAFITPFRIFFNNEATGADANWEAVVYASFVLDLCLNFTFAYIDSNGNVECRPLMIAQKYATSWMIFDIVATLPLDYVLNTDSSGRANELTRLARLPRALRLLRLLRLVKLARMGQSSNVMKWIHTDIPPAVIRLLMSSFWAALVLHLFAGIWFFVADTETGATQTWLSVYGFRDSSLFTQYLASLYFTASTFVSLGIGDITPVTDTERIIAIVMMIIGLLWGAIVISNMAAVMSELDRTESDTKEKHRQLDVFSKKSRLPRKLKLRIRTYLDQADAIEAQRASRYSQKQILEFLSPSLRQEVVLYTNAGLLSRLPSLARQNPDVQAFIVERLRRQATLPGEFISVENTTSDCMYFLSKGKVQLTESGSEITVFGAGSYFADIDCLFTPLRVASVQAITACNLYVLSREHLHQACTDFPAFGAFLRRVAVKRLRCYSDLLGEPLIAEEFLCAMEEELERQGGSTDAAATGSNAMQSDTAVAVAAAPPARPVDSYSALDALQLNHDSYAGDSSRILHLDAEVGRAADSFYENGLATRSTKQLAGLPRYYVNSFMERVHEAVKEKQEQQEQQQLREQQQRGTTGVTGGRGSKENAPLDYHLSRTAAAGSDVTTPIPLLTTARRSRELTAASASTAAVAARELQDALQGRAFHITTPDRQSAPSTITAAAAAGTASNQSSVETAQQSPVAFATSTTAATAATAAASVSRPVVRALALGPQHREANNANTLRLHCVRPHTGNGTSSSGRRRQKWEEQADSQRSSEIIDLAIRKAKQVADRQQEFVLLLEALAANQLHTSPHTLLQQLERESSGTQGTPPNHALIPGGGGGAESVESYLLPAIDDESVSVHNTTMTGPQHQHSPAVASSSTAPLVASNSTQPSSASASHGSRRLLTIVEAIAAGDRHFDSKRYLRSNSAVMPQGGTRGDEDVTVSDSLRVSSSSRRPLSSDQALLAEIDESGADGFYNLAPQSEAWKRSMAFRQIAIQSSSGGEGEGGPVDEHSANMPRLNVSKALQRSMRSLMANMRAPSARVLPTTSTSSGGASTSIPDTATSNGGTPVTSESQPRFGASDSPASSSPPPGGSSYMSGFINQSGTQHRLLGKWTLPPSSLRSLINPTTGGGPKGSIRHDEGSSANTAGGDIELIGLPHANASASSPGPEKLLHQSIGISSGSSDESSGSGGSSTTSSLAQQVRVAVESISPPLSAREGAPLLRESSPVETLETR